MSVRRSTIIDVAHLAGVSRQTVSRVLNASPNVSKKTEKKILSAMKKLKYRPDSLARSMVTKRTYLLGALTRDLRHTHSQILEGAEIWARKAGFQIVISGCEHNEHGEPVHSPLLYGQRFDGLLIVYQGSRLDTYEILDEVLEDIPIVSIGYAADKPRVTSISIENRKAARQATRHPISLGHRRIGYITGPSYYFDCEQHRPGYLDALKEAGIPPDESLIAEGSWTEDSGYSATNGLLENGRKFTAIFCQNDWMALGCLKALREHGIRVPEDTAIVGFDNIPPARFIDPPLTTVNYPGIHLGMLCVKVLTSRIRGDRSPLNKFLTDGEISIEPELIVRSSCGS